MSRADRDLDDEIAAHLAEAIADYVAKGLSPEEARFAALRDFGGVTQVAQVHREMRSFRWIADAGQDARYAWRRLTKDRVSTAIALLTLAIGIGVSTALFSVIDAVMLRPLPYPNPEQLVDVNVEEDQPDGTMSTPSPSMGDLRLWQGADDVFTSVAGWGHAFRGRIVDGPQPRRLPVMHLTESYLSMHGVAPIVGRDFTRDDMEPGAPLVALVGYGHWQSEYAASPDVIGTTVRLGDDVATIVGVLPAWFNATMPFALPLQVPRREHSWRGTGRIVVYGRLRADVTIEQARERLTARMPERRWRDGKVTDVRVRVDSRLANETTGKRTTVNLLAGAVALILLIACVNVAAVLLARGAGREPELALRASLGAGRGRLMRQLLTESFVLAAAGGVLGALIAWASLDALAAALPVRPATNAPIVMNLRVLMMTAALLIPATVLFGALPAMRLSRVRIPATLARGRHLGSPFTRRSGQFLIAGETALALVLLAASGLMLRSFGRITATDLGFRPDGLTTITVLPLDQQITTHAGTYAALMQQIRTIPGVSSVGLVDNFVFGGTRYTEFVTDGKETFGALFSATPSYLETIGARLQAGRYLSEAEFTAGFRGVVINESAARAMFGSEPAVGRAFSRIQSDDVWTVIGVIADIRHAGPLDTRRRNLPQLFFPFAPSPDDRTQAMTIVMRSDTTPPQLAEHLRAAAQASGPRLLVEGISTAASMFDERVIAPKRQTVLLALLGALGLVLAQVGIFGMTAYAVVRRTPEIGVRMAFGARPAQIVGAVLRDTAIPMAAGVVLGLGGAWLARPAIQSLLFETTATDPIAIGGAAIFLAGAGCLAAWASARRAARVDPALSLRAE